MDAVKEPTPEVSVAADVADAADPADAADLFTKVKAKKSNKRKHDQEMDTEGSAASKRPQFPALSGDKLKVRFRFENCFYTPIHVSPPRSRCH